MLLDADILWRQNGRHARAKVSLATGITALIGPSGAGKTTLARYLAGLDRALGGHIRFGRETLFHAKKNVFVPAVARSIGLVAQDAGLFPHMTVQQNIAFSPASSPESCANAINITRCQSLRDRAPETLSGGERRRVAIARALAACPRLLILDEPMTGLDPKSRQEILPLIKRLNREDGVPILFVTHHLEDMLAVADNAMLMAPGEIVAAGQLEDIVGSVDCARLLGLDDAGQLVRGTVTAHENGTIHVDIDGGTVVLPDGGEAVGSIVMLRILSSDVAISKSRIPDLSIINQLPARIELIEKLETNAFVHLALQPSGGIIKSSIAIPTVDRLNLKEGDGVFALIKAVSVKDVLLEPEHTPQKR